MTVIDNSILTHVCPKCQQEKTLTQEFWSFKRKLPRKYACKKCINSINRLNIDIREKAKIIMREKRSKPDGRLALNTAARKWKAENKKKVQEQRRKYFEKQGKQYFPRDQQYRRQKIEKEYDKIIEMNARDAFEFWFSKKTDAEVVAWYTATGKPWLNPRLNKAEKFKSKYQNDHEFHTYNIMRRQLKKDLYQDGIADLMRQALNHQGRSKRVEDILGYTINDLRKHIERQFTKGMNWDKFISGEIHIDHIHPKSSFDLSNLDEWRVCWSLPNLRPLWKKDNLKKSNKILSLL